MPRPNYLPIHSNLNALIPLNFQTSIPNPQTNHIYPNYPYDYHHRGFQFPLHSNFDYLHNQFSENPHTNNGQLLSTKNSQKPLNVPISDILLDHSKNNNLISNEKTITTLNNNLKKERDNTEIPQASEIADKNNVVNYNSQKMEVENEGIFYNKIIRFQ